MLDSVPSAVSPRAAQEPTSREVCLGSFATGSSQPQVRPCPPCHNAGRSCRRMLLVPLIVVAAARGLAQPSALRVIELYQGLVRAFQRRGKAYELRCGQLYERTIAAFTDQ